MVNKKIAYIYSEDLIRQSNRLPTMLNRASIVQDLINSYKLLKNEEIFVVQSQEATEEELKAFHSSDYVDFLKKIELEDIDDIGEDQFEYGLGYDCPIIEKIFSFCKCIAGGSLTAAKLLIADKCQIAINWFGGWHHAQRDSAEGFCYINDIVIAIQKLTEKFNKVLYLDLDIHHGNGVQNAFEFSKRILTLSLHKHSAGFYPGSGDIDEVGRGKGRFYSLNVPLKEGIGHCSYLTIFNTIFPKVLEKFKPNAIVVQCGADGLSEDPLGEANLQLDTYGECLKSILKTELPIMLLGGGGYNFPNTARLWTYLTSIVTNCKLEEDIPDESEYFEQYGPCFDLQISKGLIKDSNTEDYLQEITNKILNYCDMIE